MKLQPCDLRLPRLAALLLVAGLAAGCSNTAGSIETYTPPPEPKVGTTELPAALVVALPGRDGRFAALERARAATFLDEYRDRGRGPLAATVSAADRRSAERAAAALLLLAERRGVPMGAVQVRESVGSGPQGIQLRYTEIAVVPPTCQPELGLSRSPDNTVSPNYRCALERSLAAMIAHPADLLEPSPMDGTDGARLGRVIEQYRQGKATQAEAQRNEDAAASKVSLSVGK